MQIQYAWILHCEKYESSQGSNEETAAQQPGVELQTKVKINMEKAPTGLFLVKCRAETMVCFTAFSLKADQMPIFGLLLVFFLLKSLHFMNFPQNNNW